MARKVIMGVVVSVLLVAIALFAAEKAQEKKTSEKPVQESKAVEEPKQHEGLLDQLIVAYKANDREKMGEIIKKMEQRREKMREFAKADGGHRWAHRGMGPEGCGWQMPCGGPPCQTPARRGCWGGSMGACGQPSGERMPMPCWRGGMGAWGPPACGDKPMHGWGGFGPEYSWRQGPDRRHLAPPACDMPSDDTPKTDVPPAEWGW